MYKAKKEELSTDITGISHHNFMEESIPPIWTKLLSRDTFKG
jgi:hypothetical protein